MFNVTFPPPNHLHAAKKIRPGSSAGLRGEFFRGALIKHRPIEAAVLDGFEEVRGFDALGTR